MSTISDLIFKGAKHYITSPYGRRSSFVTSAGSTSPFHYGTDYGTDGKKIPQYAIEDGYCFASAVANDGANYVWIIYPRIKKAFLHYHLDRRSISAGSSVKKGTLLGYTGMTGKATGIHLHLGVRELSPLTAERIKKMNWASLQSCDYVDPEKVSYSAQTASATKTSSADASFLPARGYFKRGDKDEKIGRIARFLRDTFPAYTSVLAMGNTFGKNLEKAVKEFQRRTGLEPDGCIGPKTIAKLKQYGFKP